MLSFILCHRIPIHGIRNDETQTDEREKAQKKAAEKTDVKADAKAAPAAAAEGDKK